MSITGYNREGLWENEVVESEIELVKNSMGEVTCSVCAVRLGDDSEPKKFVRSMLFHIS